MQRSWSVDQFAGEREKSHKTLVRKAVRLHAMVRAAKFWQGEEDVAAGVIVWKMAARPVLQYGSEVCSCPRYDSNRKLEQVQERAGRAILGLSWRFPGVVVRGDLGLVLIFYCCHS